MVAPVSTVMPESPDLEGESDSPTDKKQGGGPIVELEEHGGPITNREEFEEFDAESWTAAAENGGACGASAKSRALYASAKGASGEESTPYR